MTKKLLFVVNDPAFFLSHRAVLALAAREAGFAVEVATADGPAAAEIVALGFPHHALPLSRSGRNPVAELKSFAALFRLFRTARPNLVHLVTIKPVLYGGIAARLAGVRARVAAISGLGTVFLARGRAAILQRFLVRQAYRLALGGAGTRIVFQNPSDREAFVAFGIDRTKTVLVAGSGVDLADFPLADEPPEPVVVTMAARILRDKGVHEFVGAAALIRARLPDTVFQLAGDIDPGNPTSLTEEDCAQIERAGDVKLLGHRKDMAGLLAASHIAVLPSYREGLPKSLVEAAAAGRAVVTTDVPGCRDAIVPGQTALLVPVGTTQELADAIETLVTDRGMRQAFGRAGRELAESRFDVRSIVRQHLDIYVELTRV